MPKAYAQYSLLILVILLCGIVLSPATQGPLLFDDSNNLAPLEQVKMLSKPAQLLSLATEGGLDGRSRKLALLSFIPHNSADGINVFASKLGNLAIHLLNGLLLFLLINRIGDARNYKPPLYSSLSFVAIFLLHPINLAPIYLTIQRMTSFSTTLMLLAIIAFVSAHSRQTQDRSALLRYTFAIVVFPAIGFLIKENTVLAYSYMALLAFLVLPPSRSSLPRQALVFLLLLPSALVMVKFMLESGFQRNYAGRPFSLLERVLSEPRALTTYAYSFLVPWFHDFSIYQDDFKKSSSLIAPWTTLPALLLIVASAVSAWALRRRTPLLCFAIASFLLGHVIESTIIPLELMFEHRNYSPTIMVCLALALASGSIAQRWPQQQPALCGLLFSFSIALALLAFNHAKHWESGKSIQEYAISSKPLSPRAQMRAALEYNKDGDFKKALQHSERAWQAAPNHLGAFLQYVQLKWLVQGRDYRDVHLINSGKKWFCYDPLAEYYFRYLSKMEDELFQLFSPLALSALKAWVGPLNCPYYKNDVRFRLASMKARLGDVPGYLHGMEALINDVDSDADRINYCGQLFYVGLKKLPKACAPYMEKIRSRYSPPDIERPAQ